MHRPLVTASIAVLLIAACGDDSGSQPTTTAAQAAPSTAAPATATTSTPGATTAAAVTSSPTSTASSSSTAAPSTASPATSAATTAVSGTTVYAPEIDPASFVSEIDNPYLPWPPGSKWVYESDSEHIEVVVTDEQRTVMGVPVVVVRDTVSEDGEVTEDTYDYYAQDKDGNVWYMGEDTKEYDNGQVSTEGSWEAGVDGALPGILMPATFTVGQTFQQEYYEGVAEDMGQLISTGETLTVGGTEYHDVVVFKEWNPLEPDSKPEDKYYAPGVGVIRVEAEGGGGREDLVEFTPAG